MRKTIHVSVTVLCSLCAGVFFNAPASACSTKYYQESRVAPAVDTYRSYRRYRNVVYGDTYYRSRVAGWAASGDPQWGRGWRADTSWRGRRW